MKQANENLRGCRVYFTATVKSIGKIEVTPTTKAPFVKVDVEVSTSNGTKKLITASYYLQTPRGLAIEPPRVDTTVECYGDMDEFGDVRFFTARPYVEKVDVNNIDNVRILTPEQIEETRTYIEKRYYSGSGISQQEKLPQTGTRMVNSRYGRAFFNATVISIGKKETFGRTGMPCVKLQVELKQKDGNMKQITAAFILKTMKGRQNPVPPKNSIVECYGDMNEFGEISLFYAKPLTKTASKTKANAQTFTPQQVKERPTFFDFENNDNSQQNPLFDKPQNKGFVFPFDESQNKGSVLPF